MAFTATPLDGSSVQIPMSSVVPDGTNTPLAVEGGPSLSTGGNNLAPVSMYVKDGNDIVLGTSTDAANVNSVIGQLKQIKTNTASVTLASLPTGANTIGAVTQASGPWTDNITQVGGSAVTLGSKTSVNSFPVVIASDQGAMPMTQSGTWTVQPGNTANTTPWLATVNQGGNSATVTASNALKVDASATTQPVSGTVTMNAGSGTMNVSQLAASSVSATLQTAQAGNAVGTPLSLLGMGVAMLTVNMTGFTGTVNFEGQEDGTNFGALNAVQVGTNTITSTAVGSTSTSIARYEIPVAGLQQIQARTSGVSAGTVTVTAHAVPVPYNGKVINANQVGTWNVGLLDSAGTNKLAIDASGRLTLIPNSSINNAQLAGTAVSVNQGTVDAGTQRVVQGGAATGTKSNAVGSVSSVTILASNTNRKGAMVYNDSTAILYLDLSGGTASNSSYSVQVPAQGFFELPGATIYNGAITGIWASATGNARITEFS